MEGFGICSITHSLHSITTTLNTYSFFFLFSDSFHAPNSAITESGKVEIEIENRLFIKKQEGKNILIFLLSQQIFLSKRKSQKREEKKKNKAK